MNEYTAVLESGYEDLAEAALEAAAQLWMESERLPGIAD